MIGSLSNDDGDGKENSKKLIEFNWQNNNSARASRFFVHTYFLAVVARQQREVPDFPRGREHKTTTFLFFFWTLIQSFRIQLQKNLPTFGELNKNKGDKVWGFANSTSFPGFSPTRPDGWEREPGNEVGANSLLKWRFRSRRRRW